MLGDGSEGCAAVFFSLNSSAAYALLKRCVGSCGPRCFVRFAPIPESRESFGTRSLRRLLRAAVSRVVSAHRKIRRELRRGVAGVCASIDNLCVVWTGG